MGRRADVVKRQVAAHWERRAQTFDEDFGHSVRTPAERAAWDRLLDLVIPGPGTLDALLILQQYGKLVPIELDEAAHVDGASPVQVYGRIYLPLMAPALVAVGTFALLLAWNEYLYQYLLLSSTRNMTVAVEIAQFFNSDEAPWNYMMATAIIYLLPPIAIFYGLRRYMAAGLTRGAFNG